MRRSLYYRGIAEFKTGKTADAEKSFNGAIKANPKEHRIAGLPHGQIALARKDLDTANLDVESRHSK